MQIFSIYFWFLVWIFFKFRILIINVISRICAISTLNVVFLLLCTPPFSQIHKFTHKRVWIKTALYNNIFILYIMIKNRTHKDVWKCEKVNFYMHAISLPPLRKTIYRHLFFHFFAQKFGKPKMFIVPLHSHSALASHSRHRSTKSAGDQGLCSPHSCIALWGPQRRRIARSSHYHRTHVHV